MLVCIPWSNTSAWVFSFVFKSFLHKHGKMQQCGTLCSEKYDKFSAAINPFCDLFNSFVFLFPGMMKLKQYYLKLWGAIKTPIVDQDNHSSCCWSPGLDHCSFTLFDQLLADFCQDFFAHDEDIALAKWNFEHVNSCTLTISNNEVNNNLMLLHVTFCNVTNTFYIGKHANYHYY